MLNILCRKKLICVHDLFIIIVIIIMTIGFSERQTFRRVSCSSLNSETTTQSIDSERQTGKQTHKMTLTLRKSVYRQKAGLISVYSRALRRIRPVQSSKWRSESRCQRHHREEAEQLLRLVFLRWLIQTFEVTAQLYSFCEILNVILHWAFLLFLGFTSGFSVWSDLDLASLMDRDFDFHFHLQQPSLVNCAIDFTEVIGIF